MTRLKPFLGLAQLSMIIYAFYYIHCVIIFVVFYALYSTHSISNNIPNIIFHALLFYAFAFYAFIFFAFGFYDSIATDYGVGY